MISDQYQTIVYGRVNGTIVPIGSLLINSAGQLILTPSSGGGGGGGGVANQVYDPVEEGYRTLTAPSGILTVSAVGA